MTDIRVDHVGFAVESIADAEPFLELLGCSKLTEETDDALGFTWAYYELGGASRLELIEPTGESDSFLTGFLDEYGPGLHHVTLEVADIDAVIDRLEAADVRVVDRADRDGYSEAFISPRNPTGALIQLMEYHAAYTDRYDESFFIHGQPLGQPDDAT